jgi:hypothetical protein
MRSRPAYHAAMSFFEPPARPPESVARAVVVSPPAWLGPPHNLLPGIAPVELVIARTDETVVALAGIQAYPATPGEVRAHLAQHAGHLLDFVEEPEAAEWRQSERERRRTGAAIT